MDDNKHLLVKEAISNLKLNSINNLIISNKIELHKNGNLKAFCSSIADLTRLNFQYNQLAVGILVNDLHKNLGHGGPPSFSVSCQRLTDANVLDVTVNNWVQENASRLQKMFVFSRDYLFDFFGLVTILEKYVCKIGEEIVESPQFMWMRTSIQLWGNAPNANFEKIRETYNLLSQFKIMHASPTLFNSCLRNNQLSSCFLLTLEEDSIPGIFSTLKDCALITKCGGGIGLDLSCLRSKQGLILSTQNKCKGVVPVIQLLEAIAKYVDQGGRRPGAMCLYFDPSHPEIEEIIEIKCDKAFHGETVAKALDIFIGLWVPDLFMKRVSTGEDWSLIDTKYAEQLSTCYGEEYEDLYTTLELDPKNVTKKINAAELFDKILRILFETGGPSILFKDNANTLSNQKNYGVIRSSNLCTEILEHSSPNETSVCNLAHINLAKMVPDGYKAEPYTKCKSYETLFDFNKLINYTKVLVRNLNRTIDTTLYTTDKAEFSNLIHRPIGIGIQGLQDVFYKLMIPFESEDARQLNLEIFETIYFAALEEGLALSQFVSEGTYPKWMFWKEPKQIGYKSFKAGKVDLLNGETKKFTDCPLAKGLTHVDLCEQRWSHMKTLDSSLYSKFFVDPLSPILFAKDWQKLKADIQIHGVVNSLRIALMPTASTSQICGSYECFEPATSNIFVRKTNTGAHEIVNKYLQELLMNRDDWSTTVLDEIIKNKGSVQTLDCLSAHEKAVFKTVWEIDMEKYIKLQIDRLPYVDQSQSMSLYLKEPDIQKLGKLLFIGWLNCLPTGIYYLRTLPPSDVIGPAQYKDIQCSPNKEECTYCT
jgi:ribonucleoside-diphosphate reductase alpha chain